MLAQRIAINTVISAGLRIVGTVIAFFIVGLMTRYFDKTLWGEYNIVMTFGGIVTVLAEGGFYQILAREISLPGADEKKIVGNIFTLRLVLGFFIFAAAALSGWLFPYSQRTCWGIFLGMFGFWFLSGGQVLIGIFQKYLRMDKVAVAELVCRIVQLGLTFWFIKNDWGFLFLVSALLGSSLVYFALSVFFARQYVKFGLGFDFSFWRTALRQSLPLAVANGLTIIYFSSGSFLLSLFRPAADVGIFRLAFKVLEGLIFFPAMFVGLIMPLLSAAIDDKEKFARIFQRGLDVLLIFAWPLVAGGYLLAEPIIVLLGGQNYGEAAAVLRTLMLAVGVIFLSTLFSYSLISFNLQKKLLIISAVGAIFNLAFNLAFIARYSYAAAAWSSFLTEGLVAILMLAAICRQIRRPSWLVGAKSCLAAFVMAIFLRFFGGGNLFLSVGAGAVLYFAVLLSLGGIRPKEFLSLIKGNGENVFIR